MRDKSGKWLRGVTGNAGGKCKRVTELLEYARSQTLASFEYLAKVRDDASEQTSDRMTAARILVAYGVGGPPKTEALLAADAESSTVDSTATELTLEEKRALARQSLTQDVDEDASDDEDGDESAPH